MTLTDISAPIERLSEAIMYSLSGESQFDPEVIAEFYSLEKLLGVMRNSTSNLDSTKKEVLLECKRIEGSHTHVDVERVIGALDDANRQRIERIEHEAMARLVNRLRDRRDLVCESSAARSVIDSLQAESAGLEELNESKLATVNRLLRLVEDVMRSMETDPLSPDLPPLSEVDPSLLEL